MLRLLSLWDVKTKYFYLKKKNRERERGTKFSVKFGHASFEIVNCIKEGQRSKEIKGPTLIRLSIEGYMKRLKR